MAPLPVTMQIQMVSFAQQASMLEAMLEQDETIKRGSLYISMIYIYIYEDVSIP